MATSLKRKTNHLTDDERVRNFQRKIYQKAKEEPKFRFYRLYDKVYLLHFLTEAYKRVKKNRGAPGVDGVTFKQIEKKGWLSFLLNIQEEIENKTYKPQAVKRVLIPKANGKTRPLGIPTIKDRVVQMSCKMVIEPIFEADFDDSSYGFRPKRSAADAVKNIKKNLKEGYKQVYDADLSAYFDTIPHTKLLILIAQRISDNDIIHLIKLWLKAPVMEDGKMSGGKKNKVGTPQGGVISPLLANIYLDRLDRMVRNNPTFKSIRIVRYADDFVLMGHTIDDSALVMLKNFLKRLELEINQEKTKMLNAQEEAFDFLGFTFQYHNSRFKKYEKYLSIRPCKKSFNKLIDNIRESLLDYRNKPIVLTVKMLNPKLRGWLNYFTIENISHTAISRRKLRIYMKRRLFQHMKRKSQRYRYAYCRRSFYNWVGKYKLVDPEKYGIYEPLKV